MGGFRFKTTADGNFINSKESLCIPPLTNIQELVDASQEIEKGEEANLLPDKKWLTQLRDCNLNSVQ